MEVGVITSPSPSPLRSLALVISLGGNSSAYYALPTLRFLGLRVERLEARGSPFPLSWPAYSCPVTILSGSRNGVAHARPEKSYLSASSIANRASP